MPVKALIRLVYIIFFAINFSCQKTEVESITKQKTSQLPAWEDAIFYQIFPERFNNGDKNNDPTFAEIQGGWPDRYFDEALRASFASKWQVSPWTSDWYALQPWESGIPWTELFDWAKPDDPIVKNYTGTRRYGGDLQGVINKLDYLEKLGINAIYFNPVFEAPSLHKYDTKLYHHIDNNFGPNKAKDEAIWASEDPNDPTTWKWTSADSLFLNLIEQCHQRGIRVVIDGVFNHTGTEFWAFKDIVEKQNQSAYTSWYDVISFDDSSTASNEFDYRGWIGIKDLPEIKEDEKGLVTGPKAHIKAIVTRWMDPNGDGNPSDGIDGWRLDVAEMVNINFWYEFNGWVKAINPDAYITGEIWWHNFGKGEMFNAAPWLKPNTFDGVMNYRFARAVKKFVADQKTQISAKAFADSLKSIYADYPWERVLTCLNLIDSHDVDRFASQIVNPDRLIDHNSDPYSNPNYQIRKPNHEEWQKLKIAAALQFTLPGIPMVYYGTEAGMWGSDDPDQRKPMVWQEFNYQPETHNQFGKTRPADSVQFNQQLFNYYHKLIKIRKDHQALRSGKIAFLPNTQHKLLAFTRSNDIEELIIVINNQNQSIKESIQLPDTEQANYTNLINNKDIKLEGNKLNLALNAYETIILLKN